MTAVVCALILVGILAPHVLGAWRGVTIGRATVRSHRDSVRLGVRAGRWQVVGVALMVVMLIGGR